MFKKIITIFIVIIVAAGLGYWIYQSTFAPQEEVVSEGSKDCVNNEDCVVFGKTGECNCGCYDKDNFPSGTGGECFCFAPTFCKCVNSRCEGVFEEEQEILSEEGKEEEEIPEKEEEESALIPVQITFLDDLIADPDWNPDGSQIVFCIKGREAPTLHLINVGGNELKEIGPGFDPSWSPREDKIAYEMNGQIYTMNSNGGDITQLTTGYSSAQPAWNPDGTKIAYAHYGAGKPSIWTMNADGSGKTQLTTSADGECTLPSFSYDGSKIVYAKGPVWNTSLERLPTATNEIWIMNLDGSNNHKIYAPSDSYQWIFQRAWNKNNEILFMKNPLQDRKIPEMFIINSDGTNPRCMVDPPKDSFGIPISFYLDPVWDDSGTKVVAVRKMIDGPQNIVTISVEE